MKFAIISLLFLMSAGCVSSTVKSQKEPVIKLARTDSLPSKTYDEVKQDIRKMRRKFHNDFLRSGDSVLYSLADYWVTAISNDLYFYWQNTPWDFNGTTTTPKQGSIACGYFVTTILRDMDVKINRIRLAICASSIMMKKIVPTQRLANLSSMNEVAFDEKLKEWGKGVYIIGLDYHTGFIVNDGNSNWFIHSNYIERAGVVKENVLYSRALKASKTRWLVSLTGDVDFLKAWLKDIGSTRDLSTS